MALNVAPFQEEHLDGAALLLAQRHTRDRSLEPALPAAFASPEVTRPLLEQQLREAGASGVAALRDGALVGFLLATPVLPGPRQFVASVFPPRSMAIPYHGHALAQEEDPALTRELYGALAEGWVRRGFFDHFVSVPATASGLRDAWDSLGFGRDSACAIRAVDEPVKGAKRAAPVEVRQVDPEAFEAIKELSRALAEHHVRAPVFAPLLEEPLEHGFEFTRGLLADPANAHFLAYRDGEAVGMCTFMGPGFLSPLQTPQGCVYLFQGIVHQEARGMGVGSALLSRSMVWAREQGYAWCALHFATANLSGARFWLGNGFRPIEYRLHRRIDERVAWARGA